MRVIPGGAALLLAAAPAWGQTRHVLVHLDQAPGPAARAQLRAAGVDLLDPLGGRWFCAALAPGAAAPQWAQPIDPRSKVHALIRDGAVPDWCRTAQGPQGPMMAVVVVFHRDVAMPQAIAAGQRHGATIL